MLKVLPILGILVAFHGVALAADVAPPLDVFAGAGFKIMLTSGATATKQQGPDFDVYYVTWGQTGHLGLYEGCCAQTFLSGGDVERSDIVINGLRAHDSKHVAGSQISREVHIDVPPHSEPPRSYVVHAWYKSLSADDAKIADQMIATIAAN